MPLAPQVRGMLLEEFLLQLLRTSGYIPIEASNADHTLKAGASGLEIMGRGTEHQIDAIADYRLTHPFGYRQRLLVEAKFYKDRSGIEVIRNAVGVLKDVSEFWRKGDRERFHYHYAVFSASGFTPRAEAYAFAHDVYPIPLWRSAYLRNVIHALWGIREGSLRRMRTSRPGYLKDLRAVVRSSLRNRARTSEELATILEEYAARTLFDNFLTEAQRVSGALLAVTASGFVIMLVPPGEGLATNDGVAGNIERARQGDLRIHLRTVRSGLFWFLETRAGERLFSLDIPPELFRKYERPDGQRQTWYQAKHDELRHLQVVWAPNGVDGPLRLEHFELSAQWLQEVREGLQRMHET